MLKQVSILGRIRIRIKLIDPKHCKKRLHFGEQIK